MQERASSAARGYGADWRRLRDAFLAEHPMCRMCAAAGRTTAATVVDHIVPHRGDNRLRLSRWNLQPLCKPCHDAVKQAEDRAGYSSILDADGWPADPSHPANRGGITSQGAPSPRPGAKSGIELVGPGRGARRWG